MKMIAVVACFFLYLTVINCTEIPPMILDKIDNKDLKAEIQNCLQGISDMQSLDYRLVDLQLKEYKNQINICLVHLLRIKSQAVIITGNIQYEFNAFINTEQTDFKYCMDNKDKQHFWKKILPLKEKIKDIKKQPHFKMIVDKLDFSFKAIRTFQITMLHPIYNEYLLHPVNACINHLYNDLADFYLGKYFLKISYDFLKLPDTNHKKRMNKLKKRELPKPILKALIALVMFGFALAGIFLLALGILLLFVIFIPIDFYNIIMDKDIAFTESGSFKFSNKVLDFLDDKIFDSLKRLNNELFREK